MKIIAIGDIHGRVNWKQIVDQGFDHVVFVGDYLDSRDDISIVEQIHNFRQILQFKRENPDRVTLLFGNHDMHYVEGYNQQHTGYKIATFFHIKDIYREAIQNGEVQICKIIDNNLFTHAGLTKTWMINLKQHPHYDHCEGIEYNMNIFLGYKPSTFNFVGNDFFGNSVESGPVWVRPGALIEDHIEGYNQIVGHTIQKSGIHFEIDGGIFAFIDALYKDQYLVIEDGKFKVETL
jgi:predicted phosphodiesterase